MDPTSSLRFLGGAGTVTGSKFLVSSPGARVLVDCGLYQGPSELRQRNWTEPPVDPATLDAVVLTHAHLDHCGYLPKLVLAGFRGPVYATASTAALARIVLPDSGHLQEEEAAYANRKGYSRHDPALPLYTEDEAWAATEQFEPIKVGVPCEIAPGVVVDLGRAGHILGSSTVRMRIGDGPMVRFSGDLGRRHHPFLVAPDPPGDVDHLVVESTYGDRHHDDADAVDQLAATIQRTIARGGHVLIPAFAVDRTEVVLHHLDALTSSGRLDRGTPIYVDSPMALAALGVYRQAVRDHDSDVRPELWGDTDPFDLPNLHEARTVEESKAINDPPVPSIIISASGMASGGRIVHHLAQLLPDARNTVVLVGFQAEGTRGRQLADGARELKMFGRYVRVRAEIVDLPAFSVHADRDELVEWIGSADRPPDTVFLVHGEPAASTALARAVEDRYDWTTVVPRLGERVQLG